MKKLKIKRRFADVLIAHYAAQRRAQKRAELEALIAAQEAKPDPWKAAIAAQEAAMSR